MPPFFISSPNLQLYPVGQITGLLAPPQVDGNKDGAGVGDGGGQTLGIAIMHGGLASRHAGLGEQGGFFTIGLHHPATGWAIMHGGLASRHAGLGEQVMIGAV